VDRDVEANQLWVTYGQAMCLTSLSRQTIWRAVRDGEIEVAKVGRAARLRRKSLEAFMERRTAGVVR
jgi:excisionase family DNA binding protein